MHKVDKVHGKSTFQLGCMYVAIFESHAYFFHGNKMPSNKISSPKHATQILGDLQYLAIIIWSHPVCINMATVF